MDNLKIFDHKVTDDVIRQEYEQGNLIGQNLRREKFCPPKFCRVTIDFKKTLGLSSSLTFFTFKRKIVKKRFTTAVLPQFYLSLSGYIYCGQSFFVGQHFRQQLEILTVLSAQILSDNTRRSKIFFFSRSSRFLHPSLILSKTRTENK